MRSAQAAALEAVRAGAELRAVDAVARDPIAAAGRGEQFGHGLGPRRRPRGARGARGSHPRPTGTLAAGNIVTVEPGVYVPGRFGVRIEDLTVVGPEGPEVLTSIAKDLTVV